MGSSTCRRWVAAIVALVGVAGMSARGQSVNLTDLPVQANRESGKVGPDKDKYPTLFVNPKDLAMGGTSYATGFLAIHGSTSWNHDLNGEYTSLVTDIAQDGSAIVRILGDGKLLYDSGKIPTRSHVTAIVDVRGVKELQLAVLDYEGLAWNDKVILGNPVLIKRTLPDAADTPGKSGTAAPEAKIVATPLEGAAPLEIRFAGDQSKVAAKNGGGQIGRYTWTFGDGETETLRPNPTHTFAKPGLYEVVLQAEDDKGGVGAARQLITVRPSENQPPVALLKTSARLVKTGETVKLDASDSSSSNGVIVSYHWDFGDGESGEGKTAAHAYAAAGRYAVVLTVSNNGGKPSKASASIKVMGDREAPVFPLKKGARVLLIGNSLIGFCGPLDEWLMSLDKLSPQPLGLVCESRGKGLGKLEEYATWSRLAVHDKIDEGWDVVIIQPWIDALDPAVTDEQLLKSCKTLVDWSREVGAYPVLYEPQFGWTNMDADQARGHARILKFAQTLDTGFIPAGQAWLQVAKDIPMKKPTRGRNRDTDTEKFDGLMYSDFGHQSFTGALFNGLMIWRYLSGADVEHMTITPDEKEVAAQAKKAVVWPRLPYLEKIADAAITPAAKKAR